MAYYDISESIHIENNPALSAIDGVMRAIYASPIIRDLLNHWVTDLQKTIEISFEANGFKSGTGSGLLFIDPSYLNGKIYIDKNGISRSESLEFAIIHELGHALLSKKDSIVNAAMDSSISNDAWANSVYSQLGISQRASYVATDTTGTAPIGSNWTGGAPITGAIIDKGAVTVDSADVETANVDLSDMSGVNSILIIGRSGVDNTYVGSKGSDFIYGDQPNVFNFGGADHLDGNDGNDLIVGGYGDDVLIGGKGNDVLWGGDKGADNGPSDGIDTADYQASISPITITYNGTGENPTLSVKDGLGGTDTLHSIEKITGTSGRDFVSIAGEIAAGTTLTIDAGGGQSPNPKKTINLARAWGDTTTILNSAGVGSITTTSTGGHIDLVGFHTGLIGGNSNDTIIDLSSGPKTIDAGSGDNIIQVGGSGARVMGREGNDTIQGSDGGDVLIGGGGEDQINGGAGNDWINASKSSSGSVAGNAGNDVIDVTDSYALTFKFEQGDGHDTIIGRNVNTDPLGESYNDTNIEFDLTSLNSSDFALVWNYEITYASGYDDGHHYGSYYLKGDAALVIKSTGDSIYLGMVTGTALGWRGDNLPPVQPDDIPQYIVDDSYYLYLNLHFSDVTIGLGNLTVIQSSPDAYNVALSEFAADPVNGPGSTTGTSGNDTLTAGNTGGTIAAGDGNDTIYGGFGAYTIDGGSGHDVYDAFSAWADYDVTRDGNDIILANRTGIEGKMRLANVEEIFFDSDLASLSMAEILATISTTGDDVITGTALSDMLKGQAGDDILKGLIGNDVLTGGIGNDVLTGGGGDDVYRFAVGDGQDIFDDYGNGSGGSGGVDRIELGAGIVPADVTVTQANDGTDLVLTFAGNNDRITISGAILFAQWRIEQVRFANGISWSYADLMAKATTPTSGDDVFYGDETAQTLEGGAGNDKLYGRFGNDILIGGTGNDKLTGDQGSDTYVFGLGDGNDVIDDFRNATSINTLQLGAGITPEDTLINASANGLDIVIGFVGSTDSVTVKLMKISASNGIDRIQFANGTIWDYSDIMAALPAPRMANASALSATTTDDRGFPELPNGDALADDQGGIGIAKKVAQVDGLASRISPDLIHEKMPFASALAALRAGMKGFDVAPLADGSKIGLTSSDAGLTEDVDTIRTLSMIRQSMASFGIKGGEAELAWRKGENLHSIDYFA